MIDQKSSLLVCGSYAITFTTVQVALVKPNFSDLADVKSVRSGFC